MMESNNILGKMLIALIIVISVGAMGYNCYRYYERITSQPPVMFREGPLYDQPINKEPSKYQGINW